MSNPTVLSGGIFLTLLIRARKPRISARQKTLGGSDGLNNKDLFAELLKVSFHDFIAPGGNSRTFDTITANYKTCKINSNTYLSFDNDELIRRFDTEIKNTYKVVLNRMYDFVERFIDVNNMSNWLVRAILETLANDTNAEAFLFYVEPDSQPMNYTQLMCAEELCLQPFLLGIWHYIVVNRILNQSGKDTYKSWHTSNKFTSSIGNDFNQHLGVSILGAPYDLSNQLFARSRNEVIDDLNETPPIIIVPSEMTGVDNDKYSEYLSNAYDKYSQLKTLLYNDAPRNFYDFYICNHIMRKEFIRKNTYRCHTISNATISSLRECSNYILISGTGGLGKSMLMRHLLLSSINNYSEDKKLPIFIPLKDYNDSYPDLLSYVYEKYTALDGPGSIEDFSDLLSDDSCILLLDGLDEIPSSMRSNFESMLDVFTDKYKQNTFIISSRPAGSFISLHRFTVLDLAPFSKDQALSLIDKLDFRPDEPTIKLNFRNELDKQPFKTHKEFAQNPLLLTIMLMTFEQFAEVPSKMHIFYREAYTALSQKHDASKGAYKRVFKTGLTADVFSNVLSEFCARSYLDEKFEFNDLLFENYFSKLHEIQKLPVLIKANDFLADLLENMCLMYYESTKYHFTHRSFQEYFCALYFSKQKDKTLYRIGKSFENLRRRNDSDQTFPMLYDMIPEKIEEYVFLPFLEELFERCDSQKGYWSFLLEMYQIILYENGETNLYIENKPISFLYRTIISLHNFGPDVSKAPLPIDDKYPETEWVYLDEDYCDEDYDYDELIDKQDIPSDYTDKYPEPDIVGTTYEIDLEYVMEDPEYHEEVIKLLEREDFPWMIEYKAVRQYMIELKNKQSPKGDDLFDLFE